MAVVVTVTKGYDLGYVSKNQAQTGTEETTGGYCINAAQAGSRRAGGGGRAGPRWASPRARWSSARPGTRVRGGPTRVAGGRWPVRCCHDRAA